MRYYYTFEYPIDHGIGTVRVGPYEWEDQAWEQLEDTIARADEAWMVYIEVCRDIDSIADNGNRARK